MSLYNEKGLIRLRQPTIYARKGMGRSKAKKTRESEVQTNGIPNSIEQGGIFPGEAWLIKKIKEETMKILGEELQKFKEETEKTIQDLKDEVSAAKKKELEMNEQAGQLKEEIEVLKSKLFNQAERGKTDTIKTMLKMDDIEQESKLDNLRIVGIPEEEEEILQQKVLEIANEKLNLPTINEEDINFCYRLGKANQSKTRDVIVRFINREKRNLIYRCRRNMPREEDHPIYINEDLTSRRNKLFYDARSMKKSGKLTAVWTQEGNVIIKTSESSEPIPVKTQSDLRDVLNPVESTDQFDNNSDIIDYLDYDSDISTPLILLLEENCWAQHF